MATGKYHLSLTDPKSSNAHNRRRHNLRIMQPMYVVAGAQQIINSFNAKCGNPNHLYWGTAQENRQDQVENGGKTIWERTVEKHGLEKAKAMNSRKGNTNGSGNKSKPKSEEHKANIAANRKGGRQKKNAVVM